MVTQHSPVMTTTGTELEEIKIVSHSNLFYWWPVWAIGFVLALLTFWDGHLMAIVPPGTKALRSVTVKAETSYNNVDVLMAPEGKRLPPAKADVPPENPHLRMTENTTYGVVYLVVLILLIVLTNVP